MRCAAFLLSSLAAAAATADTVTYTTDPATGRLSSAEYRDANNVVTATVTYSYDANGNRTGATVSADTTPPTAPTSASAVASGSATTITVSWNASTDARGTPTYRVERCAGAGCASFADIAPASASPFTNTGLAAATSYSYRIRAVDAAGNFSGYSNVTTAVTGDFTAPGQPGTLTFSSITATSATVSWPAATDNVGVTAYEWSRNGGSTWTSTGTTRSANLTGLTASTNYTVLVRARDAAGNIGANRSGSFTTTAAADTTPPGLPGTPTFGSITATSVVVNWSAATDNVGVTGYQYSIDGGTTWVTASSGVSITGLTNGTTYTVRVRARDAAGNFGNFSSASFQTTDTTAPGVPGAPTFSNIAATSVTASWSAATDNVGVTGYQYSIDGGATWVNATSGVSITGLTPSTAYTVRVRARDAAGNFGTFSSASVTTTAGSDTTAPSAPGTPTFASITGTSVVVSWAAATDNVGVTGYQYTINGGTTWVTASSGVTITGLTNGTSYTVQVRARDAAGNFGTPSSATFSTLDTAAPSAPGTPTFGSITGTSVVVSWSAATDNVGVTGYQYSINGGSTWVAASSGVSITGLTNGTSYTVQVRARDAAANFGTPSSATFSTLDTTAPGAPGAPTFSGITGTSAVVSWSAASDNVGVTGYEYSLNGGAWTAGSSGLTLTGLTNGTNYSVQVRARDAANNTGSASSASFTTLDTAAPGAPGTPTFSGITGTSAVVSWGAASDNVGVTGYEYSLSGGTWTAGSSGLTLTGLANATGYSVQVRARDAANNIGPASSASFTTLDTSAPTTPGTPTFSGITPSSAVMSFSGSSDNVGVAGYEYSLDGGGTWSGASSGMTVSGLASFTDYTVLVRAFDGAGNRGGASSGAFKTLDGTPPGAPGTPSVGSISATNATAVWSAASDNVGVTSYEYTLNGGASWTNVGNTTSATLTGLAPATGYNVQVRARDAAGNTGAVSGATAFTTIAQITLASRSVLTTIPGFTGGAVQYHLTSAGDVLASGASSSAPVDVDDWLAPKSGMSGFEVFATLVTLSGTSNTCGTFNTWISLTANNAIPFGVGRGGPSGTAICTFDLTIRHTSNPSIILGSARIFLTFKN